MRFPLRYAILLFLSSLTFAAERRPTTQPYSWLTDYDPSQSIAQRITPPHPLQRPETQLGSFEDWLCHLPLKKGNPPVLLYDGREKSNQTAHVAVVNIDVGPRNLQQCADAIIRLRGEYLFRNATPDRVHFNFTSGDRADFSKWAAGYRPAIKGSQVRWAKTAKPDPSYPSFRVYLDTVFTYAGTLSLSKELSPTTETDPISIGDIFIQGGSPGHAVIVVDVVVHPQNHNRVFLLAQSYMPAQEIHILRNPTDPALSPWYHSDFGPTLKTPEWTFNRTDRKRF